ncbi:hypothetical protein G7Y89_g11435 [Cudoniella acicularis]|uniref:Uncharacterized protein n=1 Tax=Cudoniella acicularis TaxID=354080 RepID=A0A8H4RAW2_9HELO|nr:hypothetical protein G7Y89_g11435 [Cudoniella acicularis]
MQFKDFTIEFVDPELEAYQWAIDTVKSHGRKVVSQVVITPASKITYEGQSGYTIFRNAKFRSQLDEYLQELESSPVRSLADVIKFNNEYPDLGFSPESPDQSKLISMQNDAPLDFLPKQYQP